MAKNEYYTYKESPINGDIMMSIQVFDIIAKQVIAEDKDVSLDASKGFAMPGTKKLVNCQIENNEISITLHIKVKYGIKVTKKTKELQRMIANTVKDMANVAVKSVDICVESIDF